MTRCALRQALAAASALRWVRNLGVAAALGAALAWPPPTALAASTIHLANADDPADVAQGKALYAQRCANCHGRNRQGQPLWQLIDQYAGRRAPAHDESGHTWQHSDEDIFHMTKYGRFAAVPADAVSYMPAFKDVLSDDQILAVIAFIKASWPLGLRVSQAMLNPGYAGMPTNADAVEWTLPPNCMVTLRGKGFVPKTD